MKGPRRLYSLVWLIILGLIVPPAVRTEASDEGEVAAALVSESSYRHFLDNELYTHYGDDRWLGPEHDLARDNILALFQSFGLPAALDPFEITEGPYAGTWYNVVATKFGTLDPSVEYIIGAHYDSINWEDYEEFGAPGADDNASGVALVLEAARVLAEYESDYTIRFIAFDREEQGLYGSEAYVLEHITDDIRGMISADMVAHNDGTNSVRTESLFEASAPLQDLVAQAVSVYGEDLTWTVPEGGSSDNIPFEYAGFQATLLIESDSFGNPCLHEGCDSVDTPDYIDYEFATKITRAAAGFLVDNAGVHVDLPNADYDTDGDVDMDDFVELELCYAGSGIPVDPPCDFFDLDEDGDVDCTDWMLFRAVWTGPGDPPVLWLCRLLPPEAVEAQGGRSLVVTPPEHGMPLALLVQGDPEDPNVSCMSLAEGQRYYIQPGGGIVRTDEPEYQMYDAWGTVVVTGYEIVPETHYRVWCDYGPAGLSSTGAYTTTGRWGDVVGNFVGGEWTPPDNNVDFLDIYSIVEAFMHLPTAPPIFWVDLVGQSGNECTPDAAIDFLDISAAVEAFKGNSYWESMSWCPAPCE